MFQKLIENLRQRHFWRRATFNELSALYMSELLRELAKNLATLFIYAFLFAKGYSLIFLAMFAVFHRLMELIFGVLSLFFIAFFGAKKCLFASNFLYIPSLLSFAMLDQWGEVAVCLGGMLLALTTEMHRTSYNVLFSEVKTNQNSGKEIGYALIFQKLAGVIAPFLGGWLATYFSAEVAMWTAAGLFLVASASFIKVPVSAKKQHQLNFKGFPWRSYRSIFIGQFGRGFDTVAGDFWPIFVALFILTEAGTYEVVGWLKSLDALVMFILVFTLGRILDRNHRLIAPFFRLGSLLTAITISIQVFFRSLIGVIIGKGFYSAATTLYHVPYTKARFDAADQSGSRVVMELIMTIVSNLSAVLATLLLLTCLVYFGDPKSAFMMFFVISGAVNVIFATSNFPIFRNK